MAALSDEERIKKFIEEVLEKIKPLPGRISELLQRRGGRCLTAADDSVLRYWEFIRVELSGIVSSLSQMYSLSELGPDYADVYFRNWLAYSYGLAFEIWIFLDGSREQPNLRDCHAQLHRAAARCFSRDAGLPLQHTNTMRCILRMLCRLAESPCKYKNLLLAGDGDRSSRTSSSAQPHPYAADTGGNTVLVGIEGALRNKKLRWFMANREDNKTLKIISMVGPAGVGKKTLAMEVYSQLQQIGGGHHFQCCATAKVSPRVDIKELLKYILSQIQKAEAVALEVSIGPSPITTPEDEEHALLAGNINQCLQGKSNEARQ